MTGRMYVFMETNDIFPFEQKGYRRGSYVYQNQLLINSKIVNKNVEI